MVDFTPSTSDAASAFTAAISTDAEREVFRIAGDNSHKRLQGEIPQAVAAVIGLAGALFPGRPGNPDSDRDWTTND
jgi:hypothetical protein